MTEQYPEQEIVPEGDLTLFYISMVVLLVIVVITLTMIAWRNPELYLGVFN
jgi:hypothetical protein